MELSAEKDGMEKGCFVIKQVPDYNIEKNIIEYAVSSPVAKRPLSLMEKDSLTTQVSVLSTTRIRVITDSHGHRLSAIFFSEDWEF